jgi:hypothetical protein
MASPKTALATLPAYPLDHPAPQEIVVRVREHAPQAANDFLPIEEAAVRLALTPVALRARCRRSARREGRIIAAHLGGGVVAYKLGRSWRVRFSPTAA